MRRLTQSAGLWDWVLTEEDVNEGICVDGRMGVVRRRCRGEKRRIRKTGVKFTFLNDMDLYPGRGVILWVSRSCDVLPHANPNRG